MNDSFNVDIRPAPQADPLEELLGIEHLKPRRGRWHYRHRAIPTTPTNMGLHLYVAPDGLRVVSNVAVVVRGDRAEPEWWISVTDQREEPGPRQLTRALAGFDVRNDVERADTDKTLIREQYYLPVGEHQQRTECHNVDGFTPTQPHGYTWSPPDDENTPLVYATQLTQPEVRA